MPYSERNFGENEYREVPVGTERSFGSSFTHIGEPDITVIFPDQDNAILTVGGAELITKSGREKFERRFYREPFSVVRLRGNVNQNPEERIIWEAAWFIDGTVVQRRTERPQLDIPSNFGVR